MHIIYDGVLRKKLEVIEEENTTEEEWKEYVLECKKSYKGLCNNKFIDPDLDELVQDLIKSKAYVYECKKEGMEIGEYDELYDSIIESQSISNLKDASFRLLHKDGSLDLEQIEHEIALIREDYKTEITDEDIKKATKRLVAFYKRCNPLDYRYDEDLECLVLKNERAFGKWLMVRLIISLVLVAGSLVVGLLVFPLIFPGFGWGIGAATIVLGLTLASIVILPTPAIRFMKFAILGFKVFHSLDLWQREHMRDMGAWVLIVFPLYFIFAIIAFAVTLVVGLFLAFFLTIVIAMFWLIPYQIKGWRGTL